MSARADALVDDAARAQRGRRLLWLFASSLVVVGLLFTLANPLGTYLEQRRAIDAAEERSAVLREQGDQLQARADRLRTDAEVERLAREEYGLVMPGEEAFGILPAPQPPPPPPEPPPEPRPWWQRAASAVNPFD